MLGNHARKRLANGEPSIGTWLSIPSPEAAGLVARLGFDWLTVDAEHSPVDILTLARMFSAISASGTAPMVRIPWNTPENFKRVLDAGAWGIVVPMVNSRAEAEQAVEATRYHPLGRRSVGGSGHAMSFRAESSDYYARANDEILLVLQIEHAEGVENCEEILSVPGVDACFIGPNDLAASMGLGIGTPLESDDPHVVEAIDYVLKTAKSVGVAPGIHTSGVEGINMRIEQGFQYLALASEARYMLASLGAALQDVNWSQSERDFAGDSGDEIVRY
ncbi:MAG: aldolase/citrate lyase family protein [Thermomicrobiales bacterium]